MAELSGKVLIRMCLVLSSTQAQISRCCNSGHSDGMETTSLPTIVLKICLFCVRVNAEMLETVAKGGQKKENMPNNGDYSALNISVLNMGLYISGIWPYIYICIWSSSFVWMWLYSFRAWICKIVCIMTKVLKSPLIWIYSLRALFIFLTALNPKQTWMLHKAW